MKKRILGLSIALLPLIASCALFEHENIPPKEEDTYPKEEGGNEQLPPGEGEEETKPTFDYTIFDQGESTVVVGEETYYQVCTGLYVTRQPGIYEEDFDLKLAYNKDRGKLYINYDGERPIKNSLCYMAPFKKIEVYENIPENNDEIRLTTSVDEILDTYENRCVSMNYINNVQNPGNYEYFNNLFVVSVCFIYDETETNMSLSYLVDQTHTYTIPLISLSMTYVNWFGSPYHFYNNIYEEAEQRVHLEYFDPITKDYWQRNSKIKLGGGWSKGYPQRTLNLNFKKDENGNKNEKVKTAIFGDRKQCGNPSKDLKDHIRFRLHNAGNCFEAWSGFNDAILQKAMFGTNVATTAYRPCLVYLNGEYWGLMAMREHYSDYYIKQNYGVDDDNVTMFEVKGDIIYDDGDENGATYMNQLKAFLEDARFNSSDESTVEAAYAELCEMVDMDSFVDALLCELYCCNWDYVGNYNNLKMWRSMQTSDAKYEDGKWRFCLHDADFAFTETTDYLDKNHGYSYNNWPLIRDCMKSKTFRNKLVARAEELVAENLAASNLSSITNDMYEAVKPYKSDFGRRWGQPSSFYNEWLNYKTYLNNYYTTRSNNFVSGLRNTINNQYGGF